MLSIRLAAAWFAAWLCAVLMHLFFAVVWPLLFALLLPLFGIWQWTAITSQGVFNFLAPLALGIMLEQAFAISITLFFATLLVQRHPAHRALIFALTGAFAPVVVSMILGGFDLSGTLIGAISGLIAGRLLIPPRREIDV